jgi:hypothetical protein
MTRLDFLKSRVELALHQKGQNSKEYLEALRAYEAALGTFLAE